MDNNHKNVLNLYKELLDFFLTSCDINTRES
jgi:hypothetical protein